MEGASIEPALDRIDAALARLAKATERSAAQSRALAAHNERLKAAVREALGEIDALIAQSDAGQSAP
jgi:hypothetical protein